MADVIHSQMMEKKREEGVRDARCSALTLILKYRTAATATVIHEKCSVFVSIVIDCRFKQVLAAKEDRPTWTETNKTKKERKKCITHNTNSHMKTHTGA